MIIKSEKILYGIIAIVLIFIIVVVVIFSGNKETICTNKSDQSKNGYVLETKYIIKSKGNIVKSVDVVEIITSKDQKLLEKYEKQLKRDYAFNKKTYGGYTYKITNENNKVISNVNIDYKKMDIKKFMENNEAIKKYIMNNKMTLVGIKKMYESTGATCK